MKARELRNLGVPAGLTTQTALRVVGTARESGMEMEAIRSRVREVIGDAGAYRDDPIFGDLARALLAKADARRAYVPRMHRRRSASGVPISSRSPCSS